MAGLARADLFVRGLRRRSAAVAGGDFDHARDLSERRFDVPEAAAREFGVRREQREVATGAVVRTRAVLLVERARPRSLGVFLAEHGELLGSQSSAPLLLGFDDLERLAGGGPGESMAGDDRRERAENE